MPGRRLFAFTSLSQVQRVRRRLQECGLFIDMIRTPVSLQIKGCGFCLVAAPLLRPEVHAAAEACHIIILAEADDTRTDTRHDLS